MTSWVVESNVCFSLLHSEYESKEEIMVVHSEYGNRVSCCDYWCSTSMTGPRPSRCTAELRSAVTHGHHIIKEEKYSSEWTLVTEQVVLRRVLEEKSNCVNRLEKFRFH